MFSKPIQPQLQLHSNKVFNQEEDLGCREGEVLLEDLLGEEELQREDFVTFAQTHPNIHHGSALATQLQLRRGEG